MQAVCATRLRRMPKYSLNCFLKGLSTTPEIFLGCGENETISYIDANKHTCTLNTALEVTKKWPEALSLAIFVKLQV